MRGPSRNNLLNFMFLIVHMALYEKELYVNMSNIS